MCGFHILVTSLVEEHRVQVHGLQQLQHTGLVAVAHGLRSAGLVAVLELGCPVIFLDQGWSLCPLHWQMDP